MLGLISTYTYLNLQLQYVPDPPILRSLMTGDPPTQKKRGHDLERRLTSRQMTSTVNWQHADNIQQLQSITMLARISKTHATGT